ncbi:hypothetical protein [Desulfomonile tiedjei]|uniref:Uncharacterized protein n=1 Tax=Desulfomonile tiedjei (strain ATCC 49306 / DSM 6799 / DCB-1) TaxID=706587 RepID=I4C3C1_DESTA|nr:hypothetical protein [Desulfomonile tiedjei]AFM24062.1 hypothetical protein Desti_1349 [Desulfomonile tiedjei DSM 6799]
MVRDGMSMRLQHSLWLDTTALCSDDARPEKLLTGRWAVRYGQNKDKGAPFINVTVFACVRSRGTGSGYPIGVSRGIPSRFRLPQEAQDGKAAA